MSATGRSAVRQPDDFYETPAWVVHALLATGDVSPRFCDPCAGTGAILRAARGYGSFGTGLSDYQPWGIEVDDVRSREDSAILFTDFFKCTTLCGPTSDIVMNPPYRHALSFVRHALKVVAWRTGTILNHRPPRVHALLRLAFLESRSRSAWLKENMPAKVRVLSKRPSFTGNGTDACAYAWFTWEQFIETKTTELTIL